jgi:hypothetical protein
MPFKPDIENKPTPGFKPDKIEKPTPGFKPDEPSAFSVAKEQLRDVLSATVIGEPTAVQKITKPQQDWADKFKGGINKKIEDVVVETGTKTPAFKVPASALGAVAQMGIEGLPIDPVTVGTGLLLGSAGNVAKSAIPKTSWLNKVIIRGKEAPKQAISETIPAETTITTPKAVESPVVESVPEDPVQTVVKALKEAGDIRKKQETLYAQERSKRLQDFIETGKSTSGEKGFYTQKGKLSGELEKVEYESIRGKVGQEQIDSLFDRIKQSPNISEFDKVSAGTGLSKLFGEYGGRVPQEGELNHLRKVFGDEMVNTLMEKRSLFTKMKDLGMEVANVPRALMASFDLSAPMRQGLFFSGRLKQWFPAFTRMFPTFGSEKSYNSLMKEIASNQHYTLARESGIKLTDLGHNMATREERFMPQLAERIPLIGKGVRASGRAYTAFLDKLRMDVFSDMVEKAKIVGRDAYTDRDLATRIADFVNVGTGRGKLGMFERAAIPLNAMLFSPRLMASRITLLNPMYYVKADPFVRKEALKSLFATSSLIGTMLGLGKLAGGDVSLDTRNSNALKIKIGNTRLDVMGGFQQYIKVISQLATGKLVSSTSGKITTLGEGYRALNRKEILGSFIESKEAPILSLATTLMKQRDISGKKIDIPTEIGNRFVPMIIQDAIELYKDNPKLLPLAILGAFGVGVQTYGGSKVKSGRKFFTPKQ